MTQKNVDLMLCPAPQFRSQELRKLCEYNSIVRVRYGEQEAFQKRIADEKKMLELAKRHAKKAISLKNYDTLLTRLIDRNKKFFTGEFGKNDVDYENYVGATTTIYKSEKTEDCLHHEEPFDLKNEMKLYLGKNEFNLSSKKGKGFQRRQSTMLDNKKSIFVLNSSENGGDAVYTIPVMYRTDPFIYKLSDPEMIEKGITVDPEVLKPIKLFVFKSLLANPEISWFKCPELPEKLLYPDNKICASASPNGTCNLFSKNGVPSISFRNGELGKIIIVYSMKRRLLSGKYMPAPLAVFDLIGNGVVYDEDGNKRLIYDQAQGILFDTPSKLPLKWKWEHYESVMRRREELKYFRVDELEDFEIDPYRMCPKKELKSAKSKRLTKKYGYKMSIKRTSKSKSIQPVKISRRGHKKSSGRGNVLKRRKESIESDEESSSKRSETEEKGKTTTSGLVDTPAILKFSEGGCCVIEPLLAPCLEDLAQKKVSIAKEESIGGGKGSKHAKSKLLPRSSKRGKGMSMRAIECFPAPDKSPLIKKISHIKPLVIRITDIVSLTIMSQEHIHIDFLSHPIHFMFNLGVRIKSTIEHVYAARHPDEVKEPIPCFFEVLQTKCMELYFINQNLKQMREEAKKRLEQDELKYVKKWGYDVHFKKHPPIH